LANLTLTTGFEQMSKTVVIYLDFEDNDIDDVDVYNYLNELMENECLSWEIDDE
jgi:hypothetical protein